MRVLVLVSDAELDRLKKIKEVDILPVVNMCPLSGEIDDLIGKKVVALTVDFSQVERMLAPDVVRVVERPVYSGDYPGF